MYVKTGPTKAEKKVEAGPKMSRYVNVKTLRKLPPVRLLRGIRPQSSRSCTFLASVVYHRSNAMRTRHTSCPHGRGGAFTLLELLIVVVIIVIAAMTAVPMMSSAASLQIRSAASMIAADLEYAKSMAISRGQYYSVVFNDANESYQIQKQVQNQDIVILHPVKKGFNFVVDFRNDSRLNRVDIVSVNFNGGNRVKFDYLGSPYDGSTPPQPLNTNTGFVTISAGSVTKTVSVEPVTGYISISD